MQHIDPATLHFLRHRRSHPPKLLSNPPPARTELMKLLELAARGVNEVLVEAGPRLAGAFARQGLVDEYQLFVAAKFLGSSARPLLDWPLAKMAEAQELKIIEMRAVGDDWRIIARPQPREA